MQLALSEEGKRKSFIVFMAIAGVALVATVLPTWLDRFGEEKSFYSHGYLIPFICAYLVYRERERLKAIPLQPARAGLAVLLLVLFNRFLWASLKINFFEGLSILLLPIGLVLYIWGWRALRALWFPILYILFMIPIPMAGVVLISYYMKVMASRWVVAFLGRIGYDLILSGNRILFGTWDELVIGDPCSGLRSLIALTAFGALFAYVSRVSLWRRWALFFLAIPCALAANFTRILALTLIAMKWGSSVAVADKIVPNPLGENWTIHDALGIAVFIPAFIFYFSAERLLELIPFGRRTKTPPKALAGAEPPADAAASPETGEPSP